MEGSEKETDKLQELSSSKNNIGHNQNENLYNKLLELEQWAAVPNVEVFECEVCLEECQSFDGVILRECIHSFCRPCLVSAIKHCEESSVACPAVGCSGTLQEREIRNLISPEDHEHWLSRSLAATEKAISKHAFHCRTHDCIGWAFIEAGVQNFVCPVCHSVSCVSCMAIHEGEDCQHFVSRIADANDDGSQTLLENLVASGEAMKCPECRVIITKATGCDWLQCSSCKTEICWVTRGYRWGPRGRGDTTGGCCCNVKRQRCHPSCNNCH